MMEVTEMEVSQPQGGLRTRMSLEESPLLQAPELCDLVTPNFALRSLPVLWYLVTTTFQLSLATE